MTAPRTLTGRDIGRAENAMRALLGSLLAKPGLSYPEWTALVTLDAAGPLASVALIQRLAADLKLPEEVVRSTIDGLRARGMIAAVDAGAGGGEPPTEDGDHRLALTEAGQATYRPIRAAVSRITGELWSDLPASDLDTTRRTLVEITRRVNARLDAAS